MIRTIECWPVFKQDPFFVIKFRNFVFVSHYSSIVSYLVINGYFLAGKWPMNFLSLQLTFSPPRRKIILFFIHEVSLYRQGRKGAT